MGLGAKDVAVPFNKFTISGESHEHPTARTSSTLGGLTARPTIPLNLKMAVLRKAQPFIYNVNGSTTSIPEILND